MTLITPLIDKDMDGNPDGGQGLCDRTPNSPLNKSISWARTNPYADALSKGESRQQAGNTKHSLGERNTGFDISAYPYDIDPANPANLANLSTMDLLRVSAYKPHLLTRRYKNPNYPEYHYAPWFDESARIYRVLEFFELGQSNLPSNSQFIPGKINWITTPSSEIRQLVQPSPDPSKPPQEVYRSFPYDTLIGRRSHVFAVWCTVGFFEADPNTRQVGRELDADKGQQVRYRFFAIVDRNILAEWMLQNRVPMLQIGVRVLQNGVPVEDMLGRTDIDPRKWWRNPPLIRPDGKPVSDMRPCVIYWSRIQ
jgi:hypothetical protein